ncbi:MAG: proton-conducting membrane transporter, partial [Oscillospiraceae bacterium]|nr:proton-conducting membrane transporter [Oscillospiraceae bacterium]
FYLFGLGYIYMLTGVLDMAAAAVAIAALDETAVALPYALIMTSIASKCSLLPMLTWLPKVNSLSGARSTVSAIMSGLHIKSGIYLFIRFQDIFGGMATDLFLILGIFTAVSGILLALAQTDMRLILAYSTIAQVGLIVAGLSLGTGYSRIGSQFHIVNHALFKVALFLCSGRIFFAYQTYDVRKIRGLLRTYPAMAWATILAILGIIGAPLFNGSMSKYLMLAGTSGVLEWIFILINLGTILVFVRFSAMLFGSPIKALPKTATDYYGLSVIFVLGIACLALGVLGVPAVGLLFNESVSFDIWGYLEKTAIFAVSLALGIILYKTVLSKRDILSSLNGLRLSFQKLIVSVCIVFAAILIYVGTVYG